MNFWMIPYHLTCPFPKRGSEWIWNHLKSATFESQQWLSGGVKYFQWPDFLNLLEVKRCEETQTAVHVEYLWILDSSMSSASISICTKESLAAIPGESKVNLRTVFHVVAWVQKEITAPRCQTGQDVASSSRQLLARQEQFSFITWDALGRIMENHCIL